MTTIEGIQPSRYFRLQQLYELVEWWQECREVDLWICQSGKPYSHPDHVCAYERVKKAERAVLEFKIED